ncbi:MAG: hypothetical protein U1U88_000953, partial [Lawsonella clevelandensis]
MPEESLEEVVHRCVSLRVNASSPNAPSRNSVTPSKTATSTKLSTRALHYDETSHNPVDNHEFSVRERLLLSAASSPLPK